MVDRSDPLNDDVAALRQALARAQREAAAARAEQSATARVLQSLVESPNEVESELNAIVREVASLCAAEAATLWRSEGEYVTALASTSDDEISRVGHRVPIGPGTLGSHVLATRQSVFVADMDELFMDRFPASREYSRRLGYRSGLWVPLVRGDAALGYLVLNPVYNRPVTPEIIAQVETFAAFAAIVIETASLIQKLTERNTDLAEALAQQTATAEVLRIISQSPTDAQRVLDAVARSVATVCAATNANIFRLDRSKLVSVAAWGPEFVPPTTLFSRPMEHGTFVGRAVERRATIHAPDLLNESEADFPRAFELYRAGAPHRTFLATPLMREAEPIGAIVVRRLEAQPFTAKQINFLETFAAQAVIAMEHARLFQELQARNDELANALARQTATAEILRVMSQSPADYQPMLDTMAASAGRVCLADIVVVYLLDGSETEVVATAGPAGDVRGKRDPLTPDRFGVIAMDERRTIHVTSAADPRLADWPHSRASMGRVGGQVALATPLLRRGEPLGFIILVRRNNQPFADDEIALVETFADQTVIALENARLFRDLQKGAIELSRSVDELRALNEVGQAVNSSLDLRVVLETVLERAVELSGGGSGFVYLYDPDTDAFNLQAALGDDPQVVEAAMKQFGQPVQHPLAVAPELIEPLRRGEPVQIGDILACAPLIDRVNAATRQTIHALGIRSATLAPLARGDRLYGVIWIDRKQPGVVPPDTLALLQTFANQSTLAIQNANLYSQIERQREELEVKSRQLEAVSRHKSEFLANMSHELRTPLNGIIGFSEILLDPTMSVDAAMQTQFLENIFQSGKHLLTLINDILDLSKVEAGKMELHPEDFDLADALQAVYAVVRALADKKQQTLTLNLPPEPVTLHHDPGRFKQILFNLLANAVKFTPNHGQITTTAHLAPPPAPQTTNTRTTNPPDQQSDPQPPPPSLVGMGTWGLDPHLRLTVTDTGIGIAPEHFAKVFDEFQQIDSDHARQEQGTGLGLPLVRNFTRLMGGEVTVQSVLGEGSAFTVWLPLRQPPTHDNVNAQDIVID